MASVNNRQKKSPIVEAFLKYQEKFNLVLQQHCIVGVLDSQVIARMQCKLVILDFVPFIILSN